MSLYDVVVGDGHQRDRRRILLPILGDPRVPAFRDTWVEEGPDGPVIAVYTRTGGPLRRCLCEFIGRAHGPDACYAACHERLAAHPLYLGDADDLVNPVYATFRFGAPEPFRAGLARAARKPADIGQRWRAALDRIQAGRLRPGEIAAGPELRAMITHEFGGAPKTTTVPA